MSDQPRISFVIATYNRRDVVLSTLQRIYCLGMRAADAEIIVVDNASADGTADAITERYPEVKLIALESNLGSCGKAVGVEQACGSYIVFLDDDSYPRPGSIERMVYKFKTDDRLGAACFRVHLADGRSECSAFPNVFIGCGVGFRSEALAEVGGLDGTLFMAAEEYDLSFRLINSGWKVETFNDMHVDHMKSPHARQSKRLAYYDTRNNLLLVARYLPNSLEKIYWSDWTTRYQWLAELEGNGMANLRGRLAAKARRAVQRYRYLSNRLTHSAVEELFCFSFIEEQMALVAERGAKRILLADWGKNVYAFFRAADRLKLEIAAIADDRFAQPGRKYRGIPICPAAEGLSMEYDAVVVSNTSPVHAMRTQQRLEPSCDKPIYRWFGYDAGSVNGRLDDVEGQVV